MRLEGKTAIIMGAATGFGAGMARVFSREGASVMVADLNEEGGRHLWTITQHTAAAIRESGVRCEGINLFLADGKAAFQEVFHLHMHIFPRYEGDSFELVSDWNVKPPRNELDLVSNKIKVAYDRLWRRFDKEGS